MNTKASPLEFLASFVLPESILDWFDVVKAEEKAVSPSEQDKYQAELHLLIAADQMYRKPPVNHVLFMS